MWCGVHPPAAMAVLKGSNVGAAYGIDLQGVRRPATGAWDVGAYQTIWTRAGGAPASKGYQVGGNSQSNSENAYCLPGDVPNFGPADGPANMPTACTYTAIAGTPSPGAVTTVAADCSNLQGVINTANAGDTIVIPASATCSGSYTLPTKTGAAAQAGRRGHRTGPLDLLIELGKSLDQCHKRYLLKGEPKMARSS